MASFHSYLGPVDTVQPFPPHAAQAAIHYVPSPTMLLDEEGCVSYANPAALAALGYSAAELSGMAFLALLDEGSRAKGRAMVRTAQREPSDEYELNVVARDGSVRLMSYRAAPVEATPARDDGGAGSVLVFGQSLDATVETTERLVTLNRRLNALFTAAAEATRSLHLPLLLRQALAVAIAELDLQAGAIFLAAGDHIPAPAVAAPAARLLAWQGFTPAFAGRVAGARDFAPLRWAGEARAGDAGELGLRGSDLPPSIGPLLNIATVPIRGDDRLVGWLCLLSDRYRAFDAGEMDTVRALGNLLGPPIENAALYGSLQERDGQLRAVLESIDSGVLLVDRDDVIRYVNKRLGALLGVDVGSWQGQARDAALPGRLTPAGQTASALGPDLWRTAGPHPLILRRFTDEVVDQDGAPLGRIEVYGDITAIYEMDRLKDEFIASAAHDLKTPVTAVKGYAQMALRTARRLEAPDLLPQLEMIVARGDDLSLLMDSLLDTSRLQAGRLRLELDTVPLSAVVTRAIRRVEFDARRQGRALAVELPPAPVEVTWDRGRIERVLINLALNALKYSPDGGDVVVEAHLGTSDEWRATSGERGREGVVVITVTDHGIGIPPDEREKVFDRFYRGRHALEEGYKGSGLGLYICRAMIEAHGGRIRAEAAAHGGSGTTMRVVLPLRAASGE